MKQRIARSISIAAVGFAVIAPSAHAANFINTFTADVYSQADHSAVETQAGSTPWTGVTAFTLNPGPLGTPQQVKDVRVDLPPGLISTPQAAPQCTQDTFANATCDKKSIIGSVTLQAVAGLPVTADVYNLVPAAGQVSDFGFKALGLLTSHIIGGVRDTGDYGLFFTISNIPNSINLSSSALTFYGDPAQQNGGGGTHALHPPAHCLHRPADHHAHGRHLRRQHLHQERHDQRPPRPSDRRHRLRPDPVHPDGQRHPRHDAARHAGRRQGRRERAVGERSDQARPVRTC